MSTESLAQNLGLHRRSVASLFLLGDWLADHILGYVRRLFVASSTLLADSRTDAQKPTQ
jgi:hypothetical protein